MYSKTVEERLSVLEERTDEWQSTLRVKLVGAAALAEGGLELANGTREFWKLKQEACELILIDLDPIMPALFPDPTQRNSIRQELKEGLSHPEFVFFVFGIVPIAGRWGQEKSFDLKMRAGLPSMRLHARVKTVLTPKLKQMGGPFQLWVPLSQSDMKRKDKKRKDREDRESQPKRRGREGSKA
eukprot:s395_g3.t1